VHRPIRPTRPNAVLAAGAEGTHPDTRRRDKEWPWESSSATWSSCRRCDVDLCTVARWDDGQIVEENLFYDLVTFMKQLGLS
jgi:hypothetical protein